MNELNETIERIYQGIDQSHKEGIEAISKFFLEKMKETWIVATKEVLSENVYSAENRGKDADDYLKSKYKI